MELEYKGHLPPSCSMLGGGEGGGEKKKKEGGEKTNHIWE